MRARLHASTFEARSGRAGGMGVGTNALPTFHVRMMQSARGVLPLMIKPLLYVLAASAAYVKQRWHYHIRRGSTGVLSPMRTQRARLKGMAAGKNERRTSNWESD